MTDTAATTASARATDPVTGVPLRAANGNPIPSLGREGIATAFYGNPRQIFLSLGINFR